MVAANTTFSRLERDFFDNDLYQMFNMDLGLWFYVIIVLSIFIFFSKNSEDFYFHRILAFAVIAVGSVMTFYVQSKRNRGSVRFVKVNAIQLGVLTLNIVGVVLLGRSYIDAGYTLIQFCDEILIACWENMAFGIIVPVVLMFIFQYFRFRGKHATTIFFSTTTLSTVAFALAHWWAYSGDPTIIGWLFGIGLLIMNLCYLFSPSLSILAHLTLNILVMTKQFM
jgi:hypothetical protein